MNRQWRITRIRVHGSVALVWALELVEDRRVIHVLYFGVKQDAMDAAQRWVA